MTCWRTTSIRSIDEQEKAIVFRAIRLVVGLKQQQSGPRCPGGNSSPRCRQTAVEMTDDPSEKAEVLATRIHDRLLLAVDLDGEFPHPDSNFGDALRPHNDDTAIVRVTGWPSNLGLWDILDFRICPGLTTVDCYIPSIFQRLLQLSVVRRSTASNGVNRRPTDAFTDYLRYRASGRQEC